MSCHMAESGGPEDVDEDINPETTEALKRIASEAGKESVALTSDNVEMLGLE